MSLFYQKESDASERIEIKSYMKMIFESRTVQYYPRGYDEEYKGIIKFLGYHLIETDAGPSYVSEEETLLQAEMQLPLRTELAVQRMNDLLPYYFPQNMPLLLPKPDNQ